MRKGHTKKIETIPLYKQGDRIIFNENGQRIPATVLKVHPNFGLHGRNLYSVEEIGTRKKRMIEEDVCDIE